MVSPSQRSTKLIRSFEGVFFCSLILFLFLLVSLFSFVPLELKTYLAVPVVQCSRVLSTISCSTQFYCINLLVSRSKGTDVTQSNLFVVHVNYHDVSFGQVARKSVDKTTGLLGHTHTPQTADNSWSVMGSLRQSICVR